MSKPRGSTKHKSSPGPPIATLGLKDCVPIAVLSSDDSKAKFYRLLDYPVVHRLINIFDTDVDWDEDTLRQRLRDAAPYILPYRTRISRPCEEIEIFFSSLALYCDHYFQMFPSLSKGTVPPVPPGGPALLLSAYRNLALPSPLIDDLILSRLNRNKPAYFDATFRLFVVIPAPAAPPPVKLSPAEQMRANFQLKLASKSKSSAAPSPSSPVFKTPPAPVASTSTVISDDEVQEPAPKRARTESDRPATRPLHRGANNKGKSATADPPPIRGPFCLHGCLLIAPPSKALPIDPPRKVQTRSLTASKVPYVLVPDAPYSTPGRARRASQSSQVESLLDPPSSPPMKPAKMKKKIVATRICSPESEEQDDAMLAASDLEVVDISDPEAPTAPSGTTRAALLREIVLQTPPGDWLTPKKKGPLPAVEVLPESYIADALVPPMYTIAPLVCTTCINRGIATKCTGGGSKKPCSQCKTFKQRCIFSSYAGIAETWEQMRAVETLGPTTLSSSFALLQSLRLSCDRTYVQLLQLLDDFYRAQQHAALVFRTQREHLPKDLVESYLANPDNLTLLEQFSESVDAGRAIRSDSARGPASLSTGHTSGAPARGYHSSSAFSASGAYSFVFDLLVVGTAPTVVRSSSRAFPDSGATSGQDTAFCCRGAYLVDTNDSHFVFGLAFPHFAALLAYFKVDCSERVDSIERSPGDIVFNRSAAVGRGIRGCRGEPLYKDVLEVDKLNASSSVRFATLSYAIKMAHAFIPFKEAMLSSTHADAKEALYDIRSLHNTARKDSQFNPPPLMDNIHNTLVWYERARIERQPPSRPKRGKMAYRSSKTVEDSDSDESASEAEDQLDADVEMEVDSKNSKSTTSDHSGSGSVPSNLHFSKQAPAAVILASSRNAKENKSVCLYCGSLTHSDTECLLKSKHKDIRDKEVAEASRKSKVSLTPLIIDNPIEFPARKTYPADEKAADDRRKKKMDSKHAPSAPVPAPAEDANDANSRKRRPSQPSHIYDAEQDYEVPADPTQDVSPEVYQQAEAVVQSAGSTLQDAATIRARAKEVTRQISICGYRIQHFLSLHSHFVKGLADIRGTPFLIADKDEEMPIIPEIIAALAFSLFFIFLIVMTDMTDELRATLSMLEMNRPTSPCAQCIADDVPCYWLSLGRACMKCEIRLIRSCPGLLQEQLLNTHAVHPLSLPFSHEVYTVDQLMAQVPAAYAYLRKVHFNYQKQILRKRLALINDLDELLSLYTEFCGLLFDESAQNLVTERIAMLPNAPLTVTFPASQE
ncbi:hypothetical protein C8R45DRAFT_1112706 [Mycena sanguinolenta]|nr:hypothetical protein C8R45DRAFT_1112706 [Mycena sanguinolenta]